MSGPYRSAALVVAPEFVEVTRCGWCAWRPGFANSICSGPPHGYGRPDELNKRGDCVHYRPSVWTRLFQRLGLREPALMRVGPPREPVPASARNGGLHHRGGHVALSARGQDLRIGKRFD